MKHSRSAFPGFTLIELLMCIMLIGMLISLLMPSLSKSREGARLMLCMSNKRECVMVVAMYQGDYKILPFCNENFGDGNFLWAGPYWDGSTLDTTPAIFTCPSSMNLFEPSVPYWYYYPGRMMTWTGWPTRDADLWSEDGGGDPLVRNIWPTTRHFEDLPNETMFVEGWIAHTGYGTMIRSDESTARSTRPETWMGELPKEHP